MKANQRITQSTLPIHAEQSARIIIFGKNPAKSRWIYATQLEKCLLVRKQYMERNFRLRRPPIVLTVDIMAPFDDGVTRRPQCEADHDESYVGRIVAGAFIGFNMFYSSDGTPYIFVFGKPVHLRDSHFEIKIISSQKYTGR